MYVCMLEYMGISTKLLTFAKMYLKTSTNSYQIWLKYWYLIAGRVTAVRFGESKKIVKKRKFKSEGYVDI